MSRNLLPTAALAVILIGVSARICSAQLLFEEVASSSGIGEYAAPVGFMAGIAAADYDNDGWVDVYVPTEAGTPDLLYRNLGNGQFMEVGITVGLGSRNQNRCALWLDYDGDGDLDLFAANDDANLNAIYALYRQDASGQFEDVTSRAGLVVRPPVIPDGESNFRSGNCAGDINKDGYVDLLTSSYNGELRLFLNNRDGSFSDISVSSNMGGLVDFFHQVVMVDFNADGWLDVYATVDFGPNQLWINQQDNTFQNVAVLAGAGNSMNDMGVTLGDYDNDGDFDIYVTNIYQGKPGDEGFKHNVLLRNDTVSPFLQFTEVAFDLGVDDGGWGWGTTFLDGDNDGWLDIAATNGRFGGAGLTDPSKFFRNLRGAGEGFEDVSDAVQYNDILYGMSLVAFDFDLDGDLDLMQNCANTPLDPSRLLLLENHLSEAPLVPPFLIVRPRMPLPNQRAIGAVVKANVNGLWMQRLISAGTSAHGQEPAEAFFGLGSNAVVDDLIIDWPDGTSAALEDVTANQVLTVYQDDIDGDRVANEQDNCPAVPNKQQEDDDGDGVGNVCDNCALYNPLQEDCQPNGIGDVCEGGPWYYGDLDGDGVVDDYDLQCMQEVRSGIFNCPGVTFEDADIFPCPDGDGELNLFDLIALLDTLAGMPPCPDPCP